MVTINVCDNAGRMYPYTVHKDFVTHASPFFDRAFNGGMIEAQTGVMNFQESNITAFGLLINYIYTGEVEGADDEPIPIDELINLWILADRVLMPKLQNASLKAIEVQTHSSFSCSPQTYRQIYDHTVKDSLLRKFLVDFLASYPTIELIDPDQLPKQMLIEMWAAARDMNPKKGVRFSPQRMKRYLVNENAVSRRRRN